MGIKMWPILCQFCYLSTVTASKFMIEATADKTLEYSANLQAPPSLSKWRA